jgi:hypothetical protein
MSQQLGIILMVDVNSAVQDGSLEGNSYLYDNMKLQGSEGLGTGKLVSAINGSQWSDGSQANEQVLNWLPYGVGSLPPTIPKSFLVDKSKNSDFKMIEKFMGLAKDGESRFSDVAAMLEEIKKISQSAGVKTKARSKHGKGRKRNIGDAGQKIMDVTGQLVDLPDNSSVPDINSLNPLITNITGEAVDTGIIYPAAYGSPDMVTDGWYWAASVDTSRPGTYAYTMHVQLYTLVFEEGEWTWAPVDMTCDAYIKISNDPKVNGFTGHGVGLLPIA